MLPFYTWLLAGRISVQRIHYLENVFKDVSQHVTAKDRAMIKIETGKMPIHIAGFQVLFVKFMTDSLHIEI